MLDSFKFAVLRILLLNIKQAISNMYRYVLSRRVTIPGDDPEEIEPDLINTPVSGNYFSHHPHQSQSVSPPSVEQLHKILSHIEDLEEITDRVGRAEKAFTYNVPNPSSSNLRVEN